ncbi:NUDIX domain-containing protein [Nesterenkonia flava]
MAALVILDGQQRVLTVRKRGTSRFMQPGGKPEPGEDGQQTALRETQEEIGLVLEPTQLIPMGTFRAAAANESGFQVVCENYLVTLGEQAPEGLAELRPAAEIEEIRWVGLQELTPAPDLAPLLTEQVAPAVRRLLDLPAL